MIWGGRWEGGSGLGTHVHPWLIHVNVWQNQHSIVKQNKVKIKIKKKINKIKTVKKVKKKKDVVICCTLYCVHCSNNRKRLLVGKKKGQVLFVLKTVLYRIAEDEQESARTSGPLEGSASCWCLCFNTSNTLHLMPRLWFCISLTLSYSIMSPLWSQLWND